jgi:hypothetical protein
MTCHVQSPAIIATATLPSFTICIGYAQAQPDSLRRSMSRSGSKTLVMLGQQTLLV